MNQFIDLTVTQGQFQVVWEYIGEGWCEDYNPSDPEDTQLLRFSCNEFVQEGYESEGITGWREVENASYCTRLPIDTLRVHLLRASDLILDALESGVYKRRLEELSWFCPEDFTQAVVKQ